MDKKDFKGEIKDGEKGDKINDNDVKDYREDIIYGTEKKERDYLLVKEPAGTAYKADRIYTYKDYLNWPEDERVELIDGKIYYMAAPSKTHQELLRRISNSFTNYLHGKSCDIYFAPFDVRIDLDFGKDSVVQPDLIVICDDEKLDDKGLNGAPDLVIEILSKSTISRDQVLKYNKYLNVGVKEYWIIDPFREIVKVNLLTSNRYKEKTYARGDVIKVKILDDLYINVTDLFDGYFGDEVVEVETAREEERVKAEKFLQQAGAETIKRLLKMGLSNKDAARGAGVGVDEVLRVSKKLEHK